MTGTAGVCVQSNVTLSHSDHVFFFVRELTHVGSMIGKIQNQFLLRA